MLHSHGTVHRVSTLFKKSNLQITNLYFSSYCRAVLVDQWIGRSPSTLAIGVRFPGSADVFIFFFCIASIFFNEMVFSLKKIEVI